jgi:general secretion pathway protein A
MDYFSILNLNKEPFSNSPDPEYFFHSRQHYGCLQKLELSLRLRRGLNVVIGDVGTGKTTLCRQLIRKFAQDDQSETHLILDPSFKNATEFLTAVAEMFGNTVDTSATDDWQLKELIKQSIFRKGVDEEKMVILIIDEGQKIPVFCLEILREFLNYETNENKLLQIAIFAQQEFEETLQEHSNFADRISLYHLLEPLNFKDTRLMIQFRLKQSSAQAKTPDIFNYPALWAIYTFSGGYPRKIIHLCHRCILTMIIQNRTKVGWFLVRSCAKRSFPEPGKKWRGASIAALIGVVAVLLAVGFAPERFKVLAVWKPEGLKTASLQNAPSRYNVPENKVQTNRVRIPKTEVQPAPAAPDNPLQQTKVERSVDTVPKAKAETVAKTSVETTVVNNRKPMELGRVALRRKETLWGLIGRVYGVVDRQYIESLTAANAFIENPDYIEAGRIILVPAIPATVNPLPIKVWWVQVEEKDRLEEAVDVLRAYPKDALPIRLVPYWSSLSDLKFAILLKEYFIDETSALKQMNKLPPSMTSKRKILSMWDKDTIFYADPYLGRGQ